MKCVNCGDPEVNDDISTKLAHNEHRMCKDCLKDYVKVCTCEKIFNKNPSRLSIVCPCPDSSATTFQMYLNFPLENLMIFLQNYKDNYYLFECCNGCKYTEKQICEDPVIGGYSAMTHCVYSKNGDSFVYEGDVLDENYVNAIKQAGIKLADPVDI